MVSISEDKLIMMVRDRGHALTMEITKSGKKIRIEYFVPKLCNINMINNLPGINKIKLGAPGATGVFETENLSDLFTFISMVPMDSDMFIDDLSEVEQYGPKR